MKYFIDTEMVRLKADGPQTVQRIAVHSEDGRELVVAVTAHDAGKEMVAFVDAKQHGTPEYWMYDAADTWPVVRSLCGGPQHPHDIKEWAAKLGSPTLPAKPVGWVSGQWVRDAWSFLRHYAGEDLAPAPAPEPAPPPPAPAPAPLPRLQTPAPKRADTSNEGDSDK